MSGDGVPDDMGKAKVLVVEDDPMIRRVLEKILSDYDVDVADDGQSALERVGKSDYDVIISDLDMPRKSGVEFMREAVASGRAVPSSFVFMTAMVTGDKILELVHEDFLVLKKPFPMSCLMDAVRERLTGASRMAKIAT